MQIEFFHGLLVAVSTESIYMQLVYVLTPPKWARRMKLFHLGDLNISVAELHDKELENAWEEWAHREEMKRYVVTYKRSRVVLILH